MELTFFDIVSESSKRRFRRVFRVEEIAKIKNKIAQDLALVDPQGCKEILDVLNPIAYNLHGRIIYLWILRKNHITNPTDTNKREYIAKGRLILVFIKFSKITRFKCLISF